MKKRQTVRLETHVQPEHYTLTLKPDLEAFVFEGEEIIDLRVEKTVDRITLHSKDLDIESAQIVQPGLDVLAHKIIQDSKKETATFLFPHKLTKGKIKLRLVFRGLLNDKMHGFYRSSYEVDGKKRYLATTQFESTDARRAFPCFDEPAQKATFEVRLVVPQGSTAISNTMPVEIIEHQSGYKTVQFAPTPKMSTYLLAFIVGDFEYVEKKTREGVLVRVFTTPGKKHQAQFALECATRTLSFFTTYFDIAYPLPVLDLIAIPDFASGAMENWGAITYRESALLIDPEHSSAMSKQWVALVIAHELSHQWFGNLVTMEWWTHLWLNEGFASYIEYLAVDHLFPKWDIWTQFIFLDLGEALRLDALKNTHPIEIDVHHPDQISEIFDAVSYSKGASIIRMLARYLGEKDFRDGLRYYLKKYSYTNTSTEHLWDSFEKVSKKPVRKIMRHWTRMPGYPLVTIEKKGQQLVLSQSRFFLHPHSKKGAKNTTVWHIPVELKGQKSSKKIMFDTKTKQLPLSFVGPHFKANFLESGFFRTKYPAEMWQAFHRDIEQKKLPASDRLGLVRDAVALAEAGEADIIAALEFIQSYKKEDDYTVWRQLASGLGRVYLLIAKESFASEYKKFACALFAPSTKKVGWNKKKKENHTETLLRSLILANAAAYGDQAIITHARKLFDHATAKKNTIHPDLRGVVYQTVAKYGGVKEYKKMLEMYKAATLHEEKNRIGGALTSFENEKLLQQTLDFAMTKHVRLQDAVGIIAGVVTNPFGGDIGWRFIKKHWPVFLERYAGSHAIAYLVQSLGALTLAREAKEISIFFKKHSAPGADRAVEQTVERIQARVLWLARDKQALSKYFSR